MTHPDQAKLNPTKTRAFVDKVWSDSIVSTLVEYIKIPNKSPVFDPDWQKNGHMERAVELLYGWARDHAAPDMTMEVVRLEGRTPVIYMEVPGVGDRKDDTVLLYGHLDKQPEMIGWGEGKGPWIPVLEGDRLYGRGGADDGYAIFASLTAINALHDQGAPHARCVVLIEGCEESGSFDLPYYIDALADRIGKPSLVVCLDSGCGNYEQLWLITSLRGMVVANLRVDILREGVHSGDASGVVASSFRILRHVLDRLEDSATGALVPEDLYVEIPRDRIEQAGRVAEALGPALWDHFPFVEGARPMASDGTELVLNRTWRPTVSVTGADGMPELGDAGNVLRPFTAVKLSLRLPPTVDTARAAERIKTLLEADPPYGARVQLVGNVESADGWNAPAVAPWLADSLSRASNTHFGKDVVYMGEGGSIPFMGMLGAKFPEAQFAITGVLGPESNAHGPNEFLHLPTARRLTCCVADVLVDHATR
ncbi:MAG: M20 family metallopeptidase [Proteobacteria bacterium]|nr:M20 family metallopeptidase [Pseudomonadota bacterium]